MVETDVVKNGLARVGLPLADDQQRQLNERVGALLDRALSQVLDLASPEWLAKAQDRRPAGALAEASVTDLLAEARRRRPKELALAEVAITEYLLDRLGWIGSAAAETAAASGASYVELGQAIGITRQGAKRRWPGLADVAAAARRHGRPAASGPAKREVGRWKISRFERQVDFELTISAWRVVDLRLALEPVPANAPLMANPAEKSGGEFEDDLQLVTAAAVNADVRDSKTGARVPTLVIELSYPSGTYTDRDGKTVEHQAEALTAGTVLATLARLAEEMPVEVWTAASPGGSVSDETIQIVYDAVMGAEWSPPGRGETEGEWVTADWFGLQLEFRPGVYSRWENTDGEEED